MLNSSAKCQVVISDAVLILTYELLELLTGWLFLYFPPVWNGVTTAPFGCSFANNILIDVEKKEDVFLPFLFQLYDINKQEKAHIDSF